MNPQLPKRKAADLGLPQRLGVGGEWLNAKAQRREFWCEVYIRQAKV
jgi:hypothetical protein